MGEPNKKGVVNYTYAKKNKIFITEIENNVAHILCVKPEIGALMELRRVLECPLQIKIVSENEFNENLTKYYEQVEGNKSEIEQNIKDNIDLGSLLEEMPESEEILESDQGAPIIKLINALLGEAIKLNASDIHFEVFQNEYVVRFRIDGILHEIYKPQKNLSTLMVSRIKVMAKLDIAEKKVPQDGRISIKVAGRMIDVRVAVLPSNHGERVVLRILDKRSAKLELKELGAKEKTIETIEKMIHHSHGMILVTGPTGSGKTTTLYAAINHLNDVSRNILTIEDPVEYDLQGIGQTQVNTKVGMTFAKGLRAILRQDPDVIMVGEIRDKETANIAIEASLTGHLVLSTLHTNNALGAINRLQDMGVQPFLLSSCLIGVMAQRLTRKLCDACKEPFLLEQEDCEKIGIPYKEMKVFRPVGCPECKNIGYKGRIGIYEIIVIDEKIRKMIYDQVSEQTLRNYINQKSDDLLRDGFKRVLEGVTSLEEIYRVTNISQNGAEKDG